MRPPRRCALRLGLPPYFEDAGVETLRVRPVPLHHETPREVVHRRGRVDVVRTDRRIEQTDGFDVDPYRLIYIAFLRVAVPEVDVNTSDGRIVAAEQISEHVPRLRISLHRLLELLLLSQEVTQYEQALRVVRMKLADG